MDPLVIFALLVAFIAYLALRSPSASASSASASMGCASSSSNESAGDRRPVRNPNAAIDNNYNSLAEVEAALRRAGLESSDLILAVDFTKSNTWQGERSFRGQSLHALSHLEPNPYEQVIATFADVLLKKLDDDCTVPLYGFGDSITSNKNVFLIHDEPCRSKEELLSAYADAASSVTLSGPTSFAPIIYEAIDTCKATGKYQILVIIADGLMDDMNETIAAIVAASEHPLSIIMVGVGDGPWDSMERFDDEIPNRRFDNFQFLSFTKLLHSHPDPHQRACRFALDALMELPEQYAIIKRMGMLSRPANPAQPFARRLSGKHRIRKSAPVRVADVQLEGQPGGASSSAGHYAHTNAPGGLNPPPYAPVKRC